ncbi:MAG TPA: hypothetical protein VGN12_16885 [Pirellulales bacterium]|jgi:hypothetical protein
MSQSVFQKAESQLVPDGSYEKDDIAGLKIALRLAHEAFGDDYPVTAGVNSWTTAKTVLLPYLGRSSARNVYLELIGPFEYRESLVH